MSGYWYQRSVEIIEKAVRACREEGITDIIEITKRIDALYPFGERNRYPYKMWLKARRNIVGDRRKKSKGELVRLAEWNAGAQQWNEVPQ